MFNFKVTHTEGAARTGVISTPHGSVATPAFIFCATQAALKCTPPTLIASSGTQIILSNTYHLMINGGSTLMKKAGGIHNFMGWSGPTLTDSGGFQIFSLGHGSVANEIKRKRSNAHNKSLVKITEEGAIFRSHIDGTKHFLSPEKSIQVQCDIGSDIALVLDECTPFHVNKEYTERSMDMSHRWEARSKLEFDKLQASQETRKQVLYGIVQGGIYEDLRRISADFVNQQDFFGIAIGGSLGGSKQQMHDIASHTCRLLDPSRPRHLLGIGTISDIIALANCGIDTFDCVHPTRIARHGAAIVRYSSGETTNPDRGINLRNQRFKEDMRPIDGECECYACNSFSRSYIHYLLKIEEPLGMTLITAHNMQQMNNLMSDIRQGIMTNTMKNVHDCWLGKTSIQNQNNDYCSNS